MPVHFLTRTAAQGDNPEVPKLLYPFRPHVKKKPVLAALAPRLRISGIPEVVKWRAGFEALGIRGRDEEGLLPVCVPQD